MTISHFLFIITLGVLCRFGDGLKCYRCYSNQEGCGKELSIRLNRLESCPGMPYGAGENFCVKVIEKRGSEEFYTRECLSTLRGHTWHRQRIPTVQRHGYCEPARNNDPNNRFDMDNKYCFCNDWNGCNGASGIQVTVYTGLLLAVLSTLVKSLVSL